MLNSQSMASETKYSKKIRCFLLFHTPTRISNSKDEIITNQKPIVYGMMMKVLLWRATSMSILHDEPWLIFKDKINVHYWQIFWNRTAIMHLLKSCSKQPYQPKLPRKSQTIRYNYTSHFNHQLHLHKLPTRKINNRSCK